MDYNGLQWCPSLAKYHKIGHHKHCHIRWNETRICFRIFRNRMTLIFHLQHEPTSNGNMPVESRYRTAYLSSPSVTVYETLAVDISTALTLTFGMQQSCRTFYLMAIVMLVQSTICIIIISCQNTRIALTFTFDGNSDAYHICYRSRNIHSLKGHDLERNL